MTNKPRYQVACYDDDGNERVYREYNRYLAAIHAFKYAVYQVSCGAAKFTKVYMFDSDHPDCGLYVVARYDASFN